MKAGTRVKLGTFNGSDRTPPNCNTRENYWALIGEHGTVLGFDPHLGRYLVQFDCAVKELGLHCHNPEPDSLYILGTDLVSSEDKNAA